MPAYYYKRTIIQTGAIDLVRRDFRSHEGFVSQLEIFRKNWAGVKEFQEIPIGCIRNLFDEKVIYRLDRDWIVLNITWPEDI